MNVHPLRQCLLLALGVCIFAGGRLRWFGVSVTMLVVGAVVADCFADLAILVAGVRHDFERGNFDWRRSRLIACFNQDRALVESAAPALGASTVFMMLVALFGRKHPISESP